MLRLEIVNYAEKASAELQEKKKPVQYIGLIAPAVESIVGKMSLRLVLQKTQNDPDKLKFFVSNVADKNDLIELLATLGLRNGIIPAVHLIECYKPFEAMFSENATPKDIHAYISNAVNEYTSSLEDKTIHTTVAIPKPKSNSPVSLRSTSMFAESKQNNQEDGIEIDEVQAVHYNSCCTIL